MRHVWNIMNNSVVCLSKTFRLTIFAQLPFATLMFYAFRYVTSPPESDWAKYTQKTLIYGSYCQKYLFNWQQITMAIGLAKNFISFAYSCFGRIKSYELIVSIYG